VGAVPSTPWAAGSNRFEDDSSPAAHGASVTPPTPGPRELRFILRKSDPDHDPLTQYIPAAIVDSVAIKKQALKRGFARFRAFIGQES